MLYPSTMFRLNGVDPERAGKAWELIPRLMQQAEAEGRYRFPRKTAIVRPQKAASSGASTSRSSPIATATP